MSAVASGRVSSLGDSTLGEIIQEIKVENGKLIQENNHLNNYFCERDMNQKRDDVI
jgi:hypothetical protein